MSNPPSGWPTITPRIFVDNVEDYVNFLKSTFLAKGDYVSARPAEMRIGDSMLMISDGEERQRYSVCLYIYVEAVDDVYQLALSAGATCVEEPWDTPYGDRRAMVEDAWGNAWQIATRSAG